MLNSIMVVQVSTNRSSRTLLKLYSMVTSLQADHLLSAAIGTAGLEPTIKLSTCKPSQTFQG